MKEIKQTAIQKLLSRLFPYRGYYCDISTRPQPTPRLIGGGYIKGLRTEFHLTEGQIRRSFSNNY